MKRMIVRKNKLRTVCAYILTEVLVFTSLQNVALAENAADYVSVPPLINTSSSGDKPNVLFVLDNSNSMDEAPSGQAVGSANAGSKSEIARNAVKDIIANFSSTARMGLMAYRQSNVGSRRLHDSQYDASFDPGNYDPDFEGDRDSTTKRYRIPNPSDEGNFIYYNVALPFYSGSNYGSKFCYSSTADFDNGSESAGAGPWDSYDCYSSKTGTSDLRQGFSSYWTRSAFSPTDSDYAQNILDFGTHLTWQFVGTTWFSNSSPGQGYLHVEIGDVDAVQMNLLNQKLAVSQFSSNTDTPLRNAGLTPIEGSLQSAADYFNGSLPSNQSYTGNTPPVPPLNTCSNDENYVILVTDGLPNVNSTGGLITSTNTAVARAASEAADLLAQGVRTFVVGFALPTGVDSSLLDTIAVAGGTGSTYLADDSETLVNSLASIFLSFANRDASSSSSAVLANNSRGEGAVFQAIYSPQKEDALGNEVSWVGSLFGLFLDENGYLREDTDGDHVLDDYLTDRVVHYFFDSTLGKTQVKRFYGSDSDTPPSDVENGTPFDVQDVEDIAVLWEARDQLGEVTDVLTQRPYGDNAATGRHIISSVDGVSSLDFIQVSDEQIANLVDVQSAASDALADAQAIFDVSDAQFSGAQQAISDLIDQRNTAIIIRDAAQANVNTAGDAIVAADAVVTAREADVTAAEDSVLTAGEGVTNAQAAVVLAQTGVSDAEVVLADANTALSGAQTAAASIDEEASFSLESADYTGSYDARYDAMIDAANLDYRNGLANLSGASSQAAFDTLLDVLINDEGADAGDAAVITALDDLTNAQDDLVEDLAHLYEDLDDYIASAVATADITRDIMAGLAGSGSIAGGDQAIVEAAIASLTAGDLNTLQQSNTNYTVGSISAERGDYLAALIATGVNANKNSVRNAIDAYDAAFAAELAAEAALDAVQGSNVGSTWGDFSGAEESLIGVYTAATAAAAADVAAAQAVVDAAQVSVNSAQAVVVTAQAAVVTAQAIVVTAQAAVVAAQDVVVIAEAAVTTAIADLANAETVRDEMVQSLVDAEALLSGAEDLLSPVEASYNLAFSSLSTAQTAYDQAAETVNNSDALINYLDVPTVEQAYDTVKYIRGEEVAGFRSRMLDYDDDGVAEPWRLGDIVHSSPALVGAPNDLYDAKHRDKTYGVFRELYKNRRNVLYVGANDGMLHAFNAGFWDISNKSFEESNLFVGGSATAHPLGSELWAYVPRSVLPHLQWMTDPNYAHTYYVDGNPIVFDANIFTADASHPFGWGSVLIVGMRFGGGDIDIDSDADGIDDITVRSSYVLFDVTNPEEAPVFMAELSEPGFGYTTSVPTVIKKRVKSSDYRSPVQNDWYVAFGSGPTELDDASSTQNAGLYIYDLQAKAFVSGFDPLNVRASGFVGDITSYDSGNNFVDNALYFGVSGGSPGSGSSGALLRTLLDQPAGSSTSTLIDTLEPVLSAPTAQVDRFGRRRITFGTGRLFMAPDNITNENRHYFGVVEPLDGAGALTYATIFQADLEDVTDIDVEDSGVISRNGGAVEIPVGDEIDTFRELIQAIRLNRDGWVLTLDESGGAPSERNISRGVTTNNVLFFTTYTPSTNTCLPEGTSELYGIDVRTGTAIPFEVFAVGDDPLSSEGNIVDRSLALGQGLASAPIVIHNSGGTTVFTSKSTTEQLNKDVRTTGIRNKRKTWRQLILE